VTRRFALLLVLPAAFTGCGLNDLQEGYDRYEQICRDASAVPPGLTPDQVERFRDENCPQGQGGK
jgi:hypothetical protein